MGDGVSIQTKRALIESGAYTPEDFGLASAPKSSKGATWAVGGSSAAADQRQITGETPLQQRQRQDAQLKALLEARKRQGYAGGGVIKGALNRLAQAKLGPQRGLKVVRDFALDIPGPAVRGKSFEHEDFGELVDLLAPYGRAKALPPDHASIFSEMINGANHPDYKDAVTRVTLDAAGKPQAAYQVLPATAAFDEPDYLAYLVSLGERGAGTQAVEHAKRMSPGKMRTYPAPSAQQFWNKVAERQPGWKVEPGGAVDVDSLLWEEPKGYAGGGAVLGGLGRLARNLSGDAPVRRGVADVIKERGGQWLSGSVEGALSGLKKRVDPELEGYFRRGQNMMPGERAEVATKIPINDWIDRQLTRYVKNEMATPEDPVRALAERGVTHDPSVGETWGRNFVHPTGEYYEKLAQNPLAQGWENASDSTLRAEPASTYQNFGSSNLNEDWINKLDPNTPFYRPKDNTVGVNLGFNHLIDELSNAINPESGLPRHLQLDPKSLERVSVPQAVERVHNINLWRAAMKAEADAAKANNAATHLHKDYPDKGFKWVELKQPAYTQDTLPNGLKLEPFPYKGQDLWTISDSNGITQIEAAATPEEALGKYSTRNTQQLQDALKYEGDTMGHCVGGYCEDVAAGRSKIYSLRDAKGQPHVTIEVVPKRAVFSDVAKYLGEDRANQLLDQGIGLKEMVQMIPNFEHSQSIAQIKGKGNKKPIDEYIPFVQDFVKSGQWSDVGDLENTNLIPRRKLLLSGDEENKVVGDYFTQEEYDAIKNSQGFASGGLIGLNPRKPLDLTVTPDDVLYGSEVDEKRAAADDQAYNESRRRMFAARQREDAAAQRLSAIDRILAELPSSTYTPPTEVTESKVAPAFSSFDEAVEAGGDLRLGLGQLLASPLMVTDIAEAGLDKLRGVRSPNRFRQVSNAISKALGGPEEPDMRLEGPHDMQFLAASLANPVNFFPTGKLGAVAKRLPRFAKGGEVDLYSLHGYN